MFDDGIVMCSDLCLFMNSNVLGEIWFRFNIKYLKCFDNFESIFYDYICEYMYMYYYFFGKWKLVIVYENYNFNIMYKSFEFKILDVCLCL